MKSITQTGGNFTYTYDDNGNIVSVVQDGKRTAYTYDALGQLTQVDDQQENATWVYEYDQGGNILSKKKYAYGVTTGEPTASKTFTYGNAKWKDQLTAANGVNITYDAIGNPLNDGTWTYTWQNGRQLARMQKTGVNASFVYNENGLRVQKTVNGLVTDYTLHGKNIVHMKQGSNNLHFFYDAQNKPAIVVYNGTSYSYAKNLQGDMVAILNSAGTAVVRYTYDAWGKPISCTGTMTTTLGKLNPFRYRSYIYDEETELYYLNNRYCSPIWQRFVSADKFVSIGQSILGTNMCTYCCNNPIAFVDYSGYLLDTIWDIISLGQSIVDVFTNPTDATAWLSLGADAISTLIPGLSGGGHIVRFATKADDVVDAAKYADDVVDAAKAINSTTELGNKIHKGYMRSNELCENIADGLKQVKRNSDFFANRTLRTSFGIQSRLRPDAIDKANRIIYELKPYNKEAFLQAIDQVQGYIEMMPIDKKSLYVVIDLYIVE